MVSAQGDRWVDWLHMSMPKSRVDAGYFKPLQGLRIEVTELYLTSVHADDYYGTRLWIMIAADHVKSVWLAAECGLREMIATGHGSKVF